MAAQTSSDADTIPSFRGRDILSLGRRQRRRCLHAAFQYWRSKGFPYVRLSTSEVRTLFHALSHSPLQNNSNGNRIGLSTVGCRLANYYHPQMWHARTHGHLRSPFDYFQDDEHLLKILERAPRLRPNECCWSPQAIRNLVAIYAGGRVANFRPVAARYILDRFSGDGAVVLDFSAGYGGRLLACSTLDRKYIGIDPAAKQVRGLNHMRRDLESITRTDSLILKGCAEDLLPDRHTGSVDLVFSSPPFYNIEMYSDEPSQSSQRYGTYEQWSSCFLWVIIAESRRILRRRGYLAIHVPSPDRHPLGVDALAFASKLFDLHTTVNIEMTSRPLQRAGNGGTIRSEPIYVFKKR